MRSDDEARDTATLVIEIESAKGPVQADSRRRQVKVEHIRGSGRTSADGVVSPEHDDRTHNGDEHAVEIEARDARCT